MIMTCGIGRLIFDDDTELIHAQLVRDTLLGQILNPQPGTARIHSEQNCYDFIRNECGNILAAVKFIIQLR